MPVALVNALAIAESYPCAEYRTSGTTAALELALELALALPMPAAFAVDAAASELDEVGELDEQPAARAVTARTVPPSRSDLASPRVRFMSEVFMVASVQGQLILAMS
jgi:hypothetical protein